MVDFITATYLTIMFIGIYMFSLFVILATRNRQELFAYPKPNTSHFVSVIIPVFNEEESIQDTIANVMKSNYPKKNLEIIVINDGSTDKTEEKIKELLPKYSLLKLISKKNSGKSDSANQGVKKASGDIIAIVDADSFPHKDSIRKLTGYFDDPKIGAVTSYVRLRNKDQNFLTKLQEVEYLILGWTRKILDTIGSVNVTNGPLSMYRKSYFLEVGGFKKNTITEDIELTWNILDHNYKTAMCLDANVTTIAPHKFKPWLRQRTRWGMGGLQAIWQYKRSFLKKGMFGAFILPFVSISIILGIFTFLFSSYLLAKSVLSSTLITGYSISAQTTVIKLQDFNFYPSVILFYFIVLFTVSFSYTLYILKAVKYESPTVKRVFNVLFYILIYLTLYPMVWFASIYKLARKDSSW